MEQTSYEEWRDEILAHISGKGKVTPNHVPTENERNNLVHLCFKTSLERTNRSADLAVIEQMCPDIKSITDLKERYVPAVADLIWDHWMGEPDNPTLEQVEEVCTIMCDYLYTLEEDVRNDIKPVE